MLDCAIVGSGVAGISAALTLKANGKILCFWVRPNERQNRKRGTYPQLSGLSDVSGKSLRGAEKQLAEAEISVTDERVTGVYAMGIILRF
ncbi:MAG: hypothetical protein ACLS4Z_05710 [Christensenellaceae bacterium]